MEYDSIKNRYSEYKFIYKNESQQPAPCLNIKTVFPRYGDSHVKDKSQDRLIFNMGIPILVRRHFYIETAPWALSQYEYGIFGHEDSSIKKRQSLYWDGPRKSFNVWNLSVYKKKQLDIYIT